MDDTIVREPLGKLNMEPRLEQEAESGASNDHRNKRWYSAASVMREKYVSSDLI